MQINYDIFLMYIITNMEKVFYTHDPRVNSVFKVLDKEGNIINNIKHELTDIELLDLYKWMIRINSADKKIINLQRQGFMGTYPSVQGQEACQVAASFILGKKDFLVPTFRETGMMWAKGVPLKKLMLYWMGNENGSKHPLDTEVLPICIPVGSHLPHAQGIGWSQRLKKQEEITLCSFSDGATSEGDFHAALNFAAVFKSRTIFFCQNNEFAISTKTEQQTKSKTIAEKAFAYGMQGIKVDGNDVLALIIALKEAKEMAKKNIPTLVEAKTYRLSDHTTTDNAKLYREELEVKEKLEEEPISRFEKYLISLNILDQEKIEKIKEEAKQEVETISKEALAEKDPELTEMFDYLLEETYPELESQKQALLKEYSNQ